MIDIGVASPSAQGQAMISTETAAIRPCASRLRPPYTPGREGEQRDGDDDRHEPARHLISHALDRRARALGIRDHLDDAGEHGVAPDFFSPDDERAGLVQRTSYDRFADYTRHRHGFSGHHRFIDR
jgi:hypothetical protein